MAGFMRLEAGGIVAKGVDACREGMSPLEASFEGGQAAAALLALPPLGLAPGLALRGF